MSSLTITLSGKTSALSANYFPPIELDPNTKYVCSLVDFQAYNSIPNISEANNKLYIKRKIKLVVKKGTYSSYKFYAEIQKSLDALKTNSTKYIKHVAFGGGLDNAFPGGGDGTFIQEEDTEIVNSETIAVEIPAGAYELDEIIKFLKTNVPDIAVTVNKSTAKCTIQFSNEDLSIDFAREGSLGDVLGFGKKILTKGKHVADRPVNITNINAIRIDCNIVSGSYFNDRSAHNLYEFYPNVESNYKINIQVRNLIYLPLNRHTIHTLRIDITDQNGKLIDFRGETITCRIHIKKE